LAPLERPRASCSVAAVVGREGAARRPGDVSAGEPGRATRRADRGGRYAASGARSDGPPFQRRTVEGALRLPVGIGADEPAAGAGRGNPPGTDVRPRRRATGIVRCGSRRGVGPRGRSARIRTAAQPTSSLGLLIIRAARGAGGAAANDHAQQQSESLPSHRTLHDRTSVRGSADCFNDRTQRL